MTECQHLCQWKMRRSADQEHVIRSLACVDCGDVLFSRAWLHADVAKHNAELKETRVPYRAPCRKCGDRSPAHECTVLPIVIPGM